MASPEELKEITHQFQQNTQDLQAYLRDLEGWQQEMEIKDNQLRSKGKESSNTNSQLPANKESEKPAKRKIQDPNPRQPVRKEKIRAYEYDKWDRFNVDKALEEIDEEKSNGDDEGSDSDGDGEQMGAIRAAYEKDKGNEYFKKGRYDEAIDCYTKAIQFDPTNAIFPANRAMALLKKEQFGAAERDCTVALELDPTYIKALQRRGTARSKLGRPKEALQDFKQVLELQPGEKMAEAEIMKLEKSITKASSDQVMEAVSTKKPIKDPVVQVSEVPDQIFPIQKAPHERSQKQLIRIAVEDVQEFKEPGASPTPSPKKNEPINSNVDMTKATGSGNVSQEVEKELCSSFESSRITVIPPKPRNSVQFQKAWKDLSSGQRHEYMNQLDTKDYSIIFKQSLDPQTFQTIVGVIFNSQSFTDKDVLKHVKGLATVPRVSALIMFLNESVSGMLQHLKERAKIVATAKDWKLINDKLK